MKALEILNDIIDEYDTESVREFNQAIEELKTLQSNYRAQEAIITNLSEQISDLQKHLHYKDMHISTLEEKIEPKTCEGCALIDSRTCIYCCRRVTLTDYYKPKEQS